MADQSDSNRNSSNPAGASSILSNLRSLGLPLVIGVSASVAFFVALRKGIIASDFLVRYCDNHPISQVETGMFLVGLAALCFKALNVAFQYVATDQIAIAEPTAGQTAEDADQLLSSLDEHPAPLRNSYLWRRLHDGLQFISRKRSIDGLDDELKYLADIDANRQQDSYGLVRIMIWAIPMLGFLGTVVGITMALETFGSLDLADLDGAMKVLLTGLYVAFDTTALALSLSIVLMFVQFMIDRFESQVLESVDARVAHQLVGRFAELGGGSDPHVRSIERMNHAVVRATEQLVERQSEIWQATIDAAHDRWNHLSADAGQQIQAALTNALDGSLAKHAEQMHKIGQASSSNLHQHWQGWQTALAENARAMLEQQKELVKQGDIMRRVIETTGEVIHLESTLNDNLRALAGAQNFEDTVMSLSAAIHLLNSRLGGDSTKRVELTDRDPKGRAA